MAKTGYKTLIRYESATATRSELLADSGDQQTFVGSDDIWSIDSGKSPVIRPDGIVSGVNILTPHATQNMFSIAGFTAYVGGELVEPLVTSETTARATTDTHVINSVQMDNTGAITVVKGEEGTAFDMTGRGGDGQPPYIAVGSIEIGMIRTSAQASAVLEASEILQSASDGTQERSDYPAYYAPSTLGLGIAATTAAEKHAHVKFVATLPASHTGNLVKGVHATVHVPVFADVEESEGWAPAETSPSVSSKTLYRKVTGSASSSLGTAGFTLYWNDPSSHPLRALDEHTLTFLVHADVDETPYCLTQGLIGFASTNPTEDDMGATVTIAASRKTVWFTS